MGLGIGIGISLHFDNNVPESIFGAVTDVADAINPDTTQMINPDLTDTVNPGGDS